MRRSEGSESGSGSVETEDVDISKYMDPHFAKYGHEDDIPYDIIAWLAYMDNAKNYAYWLDFYKSQELRKQRKQSNQN